MIIGNDTVTEIGDTLIISSTLSLSSLTSFTTFTDSVTGESVSNVFSKQFRYSLDGVNYNDFENCTNANFAAITFNNSNLIYFNFLYTVVSLVAGNTMTFVSITLNGNIQILLNTNFDITKVSAYSKIYRDNLDLLLLTDNLLRKLYFNGIIPKYLVRYEEQNADQDYISFFRANAEFFGLNSILIEQYEELFTIYYLLFEYLTEKGTQVSSPQVITDLQYISENFYDEIRKRGTIQAFLKSGWKIPTNKVTIPFAITQNVDGELLRMIGFTDATDEFIFHVFKNQEIGWWVDSSSPFYRGNTQIDSQINKSLIDTEDFIGASSYNLNEGLNTGSSTANLTVGTKNILIASASAGFVAINNIVDSLDYEFTFFIETAEPFDVVINPKDVNGNTLALKDANGNTIVNNKLISAGTVPVATNFYFVRCILYNKNATNILSKTNLGIGTNAINAEGAVSCEWQINSIGAYLWDIKIKPLSRPYETGFVQPANWVEFYLGNKNGKFNTVQIQDFIRHYLIPYNATLSVIDFAPVINNVTGVQAVVNLNTANMFGNLTMEGENYIDPVNSTVRVLDITMQ